MAATPSKNQKDGGKKPDGGDKPGGDKTYKEAVGGQPNEQEAKMVSSVARQK